MNNYQYVIASLPDIFLDFESDGFNYESTVSEIRAHCSSRDCRLIDWLEAGSVGSNLTPHFYHTISRKNDSRFLREFILFDKWVREAKVAYLEGAPFGSDDEEYAVLKKIFSTDNLIEREMKLDTLMWEKASELVTFDLFNIDVILSFLAKARIVSRWNDLDKTKGAELFRRLVQEVRGTFSGVEFDPAKNE